MQRIFHYDKIQNTSLIPDKILNILIYGRPFSVIIYTSYKLLKWSIFLAHPVYSGYIIVIYVLTFCCTLSRVKSIIVSD